MPRRLAAGSATLRCIRRVVGPREGSSGDGGAGGFRFLQGCQRVAYAFERGCRNRTLRCGGVWGLQRSGGRPDDDRSRSQSDGSGSIEEIGFGKAQSRPPDRRIGDKHELSTGNVGESAMGRQPGGEQGTQLLVQRIEPQGSAQGGASFTGERGFGCRSRSSRLAGVGLRIGHT